MSYAGTRWTRVPVAAVLNASYWLAREGFRLYADAKAQFNRRKDRIVNATKETPGCYPTVEFGIRHFLQPAAIPATSCCAETPR